MILLLVATFFIFMTGCATISGNISYTNPDKSPALNNSIIVDKAKDDLWKQIIPALGRQFFVINNLDKDSGIINISYNGDPEQYVDCGWITSYVKANGERTYTFPASRAYQDYEIVEPYWYSVNRKMNLEGRMNIIVEEIGANQCKITVNTRYIVTKTSTTTPWMNIGSIAFPRYVPANYSHTNTDSIAFNSGEESTFPQGTRCKATGVFETTVLSVLTKSLTIQQNKTKTVQENKTNKDSEKQTEIEKFIQSGGAIEK
jgi:hypothetical protein